MSRAARKKAAAIMDAGQEADRKRHELRQAEAKARTDELERIGAHERVRWLEKVRSGLNRFYSTADAKIKLLLNQCETLIGAMGHDVCQPPHHEYDYRDKEKLELLIHRIERAVERQPKVKAGRARADENKANALKWRLAIKEKVQGYFRAGRSNDNIGAMLALDASKAAGTDIAPSTIAKYAAKLRATKK